MQPQSRESGEAQSNSIQGPARSGGIQRHKPPDPIFLLGTHPPSLSSASPHTPAQALSSPSNGSRVANTPRLQVSLSLSKSLCSPRRAAFPCVSRQEAEARHNSSRLGCSRQETTSPPPPPHPQAVKDQAKNHTAPEKKSPALPTHRRKRSGSHPSPIERRAQGYRF